MSFFYDQCISVNLRTSAKKSGHIRVFTDTLEIEGASTAFKAAFGVWSVMGTVIQATCYLTLTASFLLSVTSNAMAQAISSTDNVALSYQLTSPVLSNNEDPPPNGGPKGSDSGGSR